MAHASGAAADALTMRNFAMDFMRKRALSESGYWPTPSQSCRWTADALKSVRSPSHVETALNLKVKKPRSMDAAALRQATVTAYGPIGLANRFFAKLSPIFAQK